MLMKKEITNVHAIYNGYTIMDIIDLQIAFSENEKILTFTLLMFHHLVKAVCIFFMLKSVCMWKTS